MATSRALATVPPPTSPRGEGERSAPRRRRLGGLLASDESLRQLAAGIAVEPGRRREGPGDLAGLREHFTSGSELLRRRRDDAAATADDVELFPTALPAVDAVLAGGLARGCLTELRGGPSSGRLSLVLSLLAATTARGETAAFVDLGDQLDPQAAAWAGIALDRLLWARPARLREALAAAEIALGGAFPLVVVELGTPPVRGAGGDEHAWLRLARAARHHRGALLVSTPYRITGTAAAEVLALSRRRGVWLGAGTSPRLLAGVESRLQREKSRRQPGATAAAGLAWQSAALVEGTAEVRGERLVATAAARAPEKAAEPPRGAGTSPAPTKSASKTPAASLGAAPPAARPSQAARSAAPPTTRPSQAARAAAARATAPSAGVMPRAVPPAARPAAPRATAGAALPATRPVAPAATRPVAPPAARPASPPAARPAASPAVRVAAPPHQLPLPGGPPSWPAPRRKVPRWVPLARAALAESMRSPAQRPAPPSVPPAPPVVPAPATARERPV